MTTSKQARDNRRTTAKKLGQKRSVPKAQQAEYNPSAYKVQNETNEVIEAARKEMKRERIDDEVIRRVNDTDDAIGKQAVARAKADFYRKPSLQAATVQSTYGGYHMPDMDVNWLVKRLDESNARIAKGDMSEVEAMLFSQAQALSAMFTTLSGRAHANIGHNIDVVEQYLRMALRAQNQCRTTLEALSEVKNPRSVAFVRQANIANGPQQVNNDSKGSRAQETQTPPNKLLEHDHGERLDFGTSQAAGRADQELETVGAVNRPRN